MIDPGGTDFLVTRVADLVRSIHISADCQVERHLPGADAELAARLTPAARILAIDGQTVTDSGELRALLMGHRETDAVTVFYETTDEAHAPISIADSVHFNGSVSLVAPQMPLESVMARLAEREGHEEVRSGATSEKGSEEEEKTKKAEEKEKVKGEGGGEEAEGKKEFISSSFPDLCMTESKEDSGLHRVLSDMKSDKRSSVSIPPALLEFDEMTMSFQVDDLSKLAIHRSSDIPETRVRQSILKVIDAVEVGACAICVCQDVNPIAEIELLAISLNVRIVAINLGVKLRMRPKPEEFAKHFIDAMTTGAWFILVNAHKSIANLRVLEELVKDAQTRNFEGFNPASKIIICLEPHPHFPRFLIQRAAVTKIQSMVSGSILSPIFVNALATSASRSRLVLSGSMLVDDAGRVSGSFSTPKRRVRINAAVDVVDILPRDVLHAPKRQSIISSNGSVALQATFSGAVNDKFFCISTAGEKGRYGVGSSLGNVYFVDSLGNSLLQAHAHDASIWDMSFNDKYRFATGCEDGSSTVWSFDTAGIDGTMLSSEETTSLGNDVYCLTYLKGVANSPLLIGGLRHELLVRSDEGVVSRLAISSNAQVMDSFAARPIVLVGGSDGSVTAVDMETVAVASKFKGHSRKLPALTIRDENQFFTGSFDSTIMSWDYRTSLSRPTGKVSFGDGKTVSPKHTLKLKNYVTGLSIDDVHLASSVGENLYLWDVRKISEVLGGYPQGWRGLSRGVIVDSAEQCVVTASQDGYVRFWQFV